VPPHPRPDAQNTKVARHGKAARSTLTDIDRQVAGIYRHHNVNDSPANAIYKPRNVNYTRVIDDYTAVNVNYTRAIQDYMHVIEDYTRVIEDCTRVILNYTRVIDVAWLVIDIYTPDIASDSRSNLDCYGNSAHDRRRDGLVLAVMGIASARRDKAIHHRDTERTEDAQRFEYYQASVRFVYAW